MLVGLFIVWIFLIAYTIWDNNRITVEKQDVPINNLPKELNGFSILQVSDLHEKEFGTNQEKLIDLINSINYDAIVFTGDMIDGVESKNYEPFYDLLDGLENKKYAWFVTGNTDPESYIVNQIVEKSDFIKGMEARGVKLLESVDTVQIDDATLNFVNFELFVGNSRKTNGVVRPSYTTTEQYQSYLNELQKELEAVNNETVMIALNHYPVVDERIDYITQNRSVNLEDLDLLIAGHYHGGQIRIPFVGALFVPEAWYGNGGLFPPQNRVKGLWDYRAVKQYVSTGLGSSDAISFLDFRLFNPPQINLLTLSNKTK